MKTLTISLLPVQIARSSSTVATGNYASSSEVVREALRLWEQREENRAIELARLKQAYENGKASGKARKVDAQTILEELHIEFNQPG